MNDTIHNLYDHASGSRFITRDEVLMLLSAGCVMCGESFGDEPTFLYETSDLWCIGLTPVVTAECQLAVLTKEGVVAETVVIVDKKAPVCLKCWIEFLRQVVMLKGKG